MIKYYYHSIYFKHDIKYQKGDKVWHRNGKLHRDAYPAVEFGNGVRLWYREGRLL